jgi:hypothetical protein
MIQGLKIAFLIISPLNRIQTKVFYSYRFSTGNKNKWEKKEKKKDVKKKTNKKNNKGAKT